MRRLAMVALVAGLLAGCGSGDTPAQARCRQSVEQFIRVKLSLPVGVAMPQRVVDAQYRACITLSAQDANRIADEVEAEHSGEIGDWYAKRASA